MPIKTHDSGFRQPETAAYLQGMTDEEAAKHPPVVREGSGVAAIYWRGSGEVRCREVGAGEASVGRNAAFILERYHALDCAGAVRVLVPDKGKRKAWMKLIKKLLNRGLVARVIVCLKPHRERDDAVAASIDDFEANADRMPTDRYRQRGLPVGSGVVESACKHIVGSYFKRAGCRWSKAGANALLAIKCCLENNRWADFLDWRGQRVAAA